MPCMLYSKAHTSQTSTRPRSCVPHMAKSCGCWIQPWHRTSFKPRGSLAMSIGIVPSILSADFTRLGDQVRDAQAAGAQRIQVDVMDGHFVPNITMGPMIVEAVRRSTALTLEAHLMITNPQQYIEDFAKAGADFIIVHQEVCPPHHRVIQQIKLAGKQAAVALRPSTPGIMLEDVLSLLDM